jgi:hypothetical protein
MLPKAAWPYDEYIDGVTKHGHVTHLTRAMGSPTSNAGNTGYCTTSTPRLSRGLVTGFFADSVWLSSVFGDAFFNE